MQPFHKRELFLLAFESLVNLHYSSWPPLANSFHRKSELSNIIKVQLSFKHSSTIFSPLSSEKFIFPHEVHPNISHEPEASRLPPSRSPKSSSSNATAAGGCICLFSMFCFDFSFSLPLFTPLARFACLAVCECVWANMIMRGRFRAQFMRARRFNVAAGWLSVGIKRKYEN